MPSSSLCLIWKPFFACWNTSPTYWNWRIKCFQPQVSTKVGKVLWRAAELRRRNGCVGNVMHVFIEQNWIEIAGSSRWSTPFWQLPRLSNTELFTAVHSTGCLRGYFWHGGTHVYLAAPVGYEQQGITHRHLLLCLGYSSMHRKARLRIHRHCAVTRMSPPPISAVDAWISHTAYPLWRLTKLSVCVCTPQAEICAVEPGLL